VVSTENPWKPPLAEAIHVLTKLSLNCNHYATRPPQHPV
jgi:hypothetical protein